MILNKRIKRELKDGFIKYSAIGFLIILSLSLVISLAAGAQSVIDTITDSTRKGNIEDGEFELQAPLNEEQLKDIENLGVKLEKSFYIDIPSIEDSTLRIFKDRGDINKIILDEGAPISSNNEIVLEKKYAEFKNVKVGENITLNNKKLTVCGIASAPDYSNIVQNLSDALADINKFSIAFVSDNFFKELTENNSQVKYNYAFKLSKDCSSSKLKEYLIELKVDKDQITNPFMLDIINKAEDSKKQLISGVNALVDGSDKVKDGAEALDNSIDDYNKNVSAMLGGSNPLTMASDKINNGSKDLLQGVKEYNEGTEEFRNNFLEFIDKNMNYEYSNLTSFIEAKDNQRITSCIDDVAINKYSSLIAGVIVFILLSYILSVFSIHIIEKESVIIGALYSLGYKKNELLKHFLIIPCLITFIASIIGTIIGFSLAPKQIASCAAYNSFPKAEVSFSPYLLLFGLVVPLLITFIVNYLVLNSKLKAEPLKLLRKEKKEHKFSNIDLKNISFINKYRIRQFIREIRGNITLFFGLFIAILLMMFGFLVYGSIDSYVKGITRDVNYKYQYILNYPMKEAPMDSEIAYTEALETNFYITDTNMSVTLQGIKEDNPYFNFTVAGDKNDIYISDAVAWKFNWKEGDTVTLKDKGKDVSYNFKVKGIVNFSTGLYVFMDIDNMRKVFNEDKEYFNTLLSDEKLDIEAGRLSSIISKEDMEEAATQMYSMMDDMVYSVLIASVALFIIVMYLLLKMMIDKSTFSISLIKVFGYSKKEVNKLYLGSNLYTVLFTSVVAIPITKIIIEIIYPYLVSNISAGLKTTMYWYLYIIMIAIIFISYLIVNALLASHLRKISLVEILKDRE